MNFSSEMTYFSHFCSQTCWELFLRIPSKDGLCKLHKPELRNNWFCSQISMENKKDHNIRKMYVFLLQSNPTHIKPPHQLSTTLKKPALVQVRGKLEKE